MPFLLDDSHTGGLVWQSFSLCMRLKFKINYCLKFPLLAWNEGGIRWDTESRIQLGFNILEMWFWYHRDKLSNICQNCSIDAFGSSLFFVLWMSVQHLTWRLTSSQTEKLAETTRVSADGMKSNSCQWPRITLKLNRSNSLVVVHFLNLNKSNMDSFSLRSHVFLVSCFIVYVKARIPAEELHASSYLDSDLNMMSMICQHSLLHVHRFVFIVSSIYSKLSSSA